MFHPSRRRAEPTAYEYNLQATEDHVDDGGLINPNAEKRMLPRGRRPNYKPTALTWPFIVMQIVLLVIVMGLIVWALEAMPDSDSTAIVDSLPSKVPSARAVKVDFGRRFRRDNSSTIVETTKTQLDVQSTTTSSNGGGTIASNSGLSSSTGLSDGAKTTDSSTAALTSTAVPVDTSRTASSGSTTVSGTVPSTTPKSVSSPTTSRPTSYTSSSGSSWSSTGTEVSSTSKTSTKSTGKSSSDDGSSFTLTSQEGKVAMTDISSTTASGRSGSTTETQLTSSPGSASPSTQTNFRKLSTFFDPTATVASISLATSIFTIKFTTTAKSSMNYTSTVTIPEHSTTFNVTSSTVLTTDRTRTGNFTRPPSTILVSYTTTETLSSTTVYSSNQWQKPSTTTVVSLVTSVGSFTTVIAPTTVGSEVVEPTTVTSVTVFPITSEVPDTTSETVIQTYVPYLSTGETVITSVVTVVVQPPPQTQAHTEAPVIVVGTSVGGGQVYTAVQTFAPQTKVVGDDEVPVTQVATPPPQTIVTQVGGSVVNNVIVITPTPTTQTLTSNVESTIGGESRTLVQNQAPQTIVTSQGGSLVTLVSTPPPLTQVTVIGGILTTVPATFTSSGFQPISYVVTTNVGAGGSTSVIISTPAPTRVITTINGTPVTLDATFPPTTYTTTFGGGLSTSIVVSTPPPTKIVTTVNGTPVTMDSTLPPITYTTRFGGLSTRIIVTTPPPSKIVKTINGTPVTFETTYPPTTYTTTFGGTGTQVRQTTETSPTASDPITLTFASTISGTLTTIIQTFPPTTYVTSSSGHLSTIITTPSPLTFLSTAPHTTSAFTSTSLPLLPSTTSGLPPAETSLVVTTKSYILSSGDYIIGTFLPPILAVCLVIPFRIIDLNAKLYQPFNSLSSPQGASGYDALTLQFTGLMGFVTPAITLLQGHPVPFITTLMVLCASFMVPLAVEAISLKLHGHCSLLSSQGCAAALGVSPTSAHVLLALAASLVLLLVLLLFFLRDWVTGLRANPWNIAGIASLARNPDVRIRGGDDASLRRSVADKIYGLGYYETPEGEEEYGLLLVDDSGRGLSGAVGGDGSGVGAGADTESENVAFAAYRDRFGRRKARSLPFMTLRYPWRAMFLGYLVGLLVLIAYYDYTLVKQVRDPTVPQYTRFHLFFDSHSFGIRFLFASLGVIITFCWQAFFVGVATIVPFHAMAYRTQPPTKSILVSRPTNAFYGIYLAAKQRHAFYIATSLMAILSEFLPILLSNIPHKLTQVLGPTLICTRLSMAVLGSMAAILGWSFFIRWPPMPVDPRSVAGMLWYVCESRTMLAGFGGMAEMSGKERHRRVEEMGSRYYYGDLVGRSRIGVDADPGFGEGVVTAYKPRGVGEGEGLDPAPNDGLGGPPPPRVGGARTGYGTVKTGQEVVRPVLGNVEDWGNGDPRANRRD